MSRAPFHVVGSVSPAAARASRTSCSIVPDEPTMTSWPIWLARRAKSDTIAATWRRHDDTADGWTFDPSGKKRFVSRSAPSLRLATASRLPRSPTMSSVLPPPMSHTSARRSKIGNAWSTPRWMRRASSTPETISTSIPASRCDPVEEVVVVLGLTDRAGRDGPHRRIEAVGDPPAAGQRGDAPLDRVVLEARHVARAGAEPHHLLLAGEHVEVVVLTEPGDHEVHGVGPHVDSSESPGHEGKAYGCGGASRSSSCDGTRIAEGGPEEPATKVETSTAAEAPYRGLGDAK